MRYCAVSIDVDPLACYYRIHGLGSVPVELADTIFGRCVPRFAELFARRGIPATFFLVGQDLDPGVAGASAGPARALVRALAAAGHEIANHSYSHPYELARLSSDRAGDELSRAHDILCAAAGRPVVGFRAPGYDLSAAMVEHLIRLGYAYDSSIFPAPGYYAAKAMVMAALAVAQRPSGAVLTNPRALVAPADPYHPDPAAPWRRGRSPLIELPIAVTPRTRTPVIGTSLFMAPGWLARRWVAAMERRVFFNLELHGIDLADAEKDHIPAELVARQPDLRVPLATKLQRFERILDLVQARYRFARLCDVAASVA